MTSPLARLGAASLACGALVLSAAPALAASGDTSAPSVRIAAGYRFFVGTALEDSSDTASLPAAVTWKQYDASGICTRSVTDYYDPTGDSYDFPLAPSATSYRFDAMDRERQSDDLTMHSTDCASPSNTSSVQLPTHSATLQQQDVFTLDSGWRQQTCRCWSGGGDVASTRVGATATYRFDASSIALIGVNGYQRGKADVYLDGTKVATVDEYVQDRSKGINRGVVWTRRFAASGPHTLKVVSTTTRKFDIDAVVTTQERL